MEAEAKTEAIWENFIFNTNKYQAKYEIICHI